MIAPRSSYEATLDLLAKMKAPEYIIKSTIQQRGREVRGLRFFDGFSHLMKLAEKNVCTEYVRFTDHLILKSTFERDILLTHIATLCHERDWPLLTSLIGKRDGTGPGPGFFKLAQDFGHVFEDTPDGRKAFWERSVQGCFNSLPDPADAAEAVAGYIRKHKL